MEHPFEMWSDRIANATTDDSRRALLIEAKVFRARHLTDTPSVRHATYAISLLHSLLAEREPAVHEARQLLSLCQTTPLASQEELTAARGYLAGLGESVPHIVSPPKERSWQQERERPQRGDRERPTRERGAKAPGQERPSARPARPEPATREVPERGSLKEAREAAADGRFDEALARLGEARQAPAQLLKTYLHLALLLAGPPSGLRAGVERLRDELAAVCALPTRRPERRSTGDDPLSRLLGVAVPEKRAARIRLIEEHADRHPETLDALAAAALRHHTRQVGAQVPAPWLVGTVARALARGGAAETSAALAELRGAGAIAAQAYDEWPFDRMVRLVARAEARGLQVLGVRRGVLVGNEPDDRKVWTLRVRAPDGEHLVAVAPHAAEPYPDGLAEEVGARLHHLCTATLLLATGSGNDALRASAHGLGLAVLERDADDDRVLDAVLALPGAAGRPPREPRAAEPAPAADRPAEGRPPRSEPVEDRGPRISDLLAADVFDAEALRVAVAGLKRPDRALRMVGRGVVLPDERLAALLSAVAACTPADRPIAEGTTMGLQGSAGEATRRVLASTPQYAGPAIEEVAAVATALMAEGWDLHRVLRGATHRETERHAALATLSAGLSGLWRLLVRQGDRRGEVWFVAELPAEGRAAVPLLLLEDWQRTIVLPNDDELAAWWATTGATAPVVRVGDAAGLSSAVGTFRAEPPAPRGDGDEQAPQGA